MKPERKTELCEAIFKALQKKDCTNGELYQLLGPTWFWSLKYSKHKNIPLHDLPEDTAMSTARARIGDES